jgi:uncharacterized membrane protein YfcA
LLHIFSNLSKLILFYKYIHYKIFILLGIPAILSVIVGAILISWSPAQYAELALGIFLCAGSIFLWISSNFQITPKPMNMIYGGIISGFLAGFTGTGGPIRAITLSAYTLNKNSFIATSSAIDMGVDISRAIIYINAGFFTTEYSELILILAVIAFTGSWLGKKIVSKISNTQFKKIVLILLLIIGISEIIKSSL